MVAQETYGLQQQDLYAIAGNGGKRLFNRGPDPWTAARALALEGEPPLRNLRIRAPQQAPPYSWLPARMDRSLLPAITSAALHLRPAIALFDSARYVR